MPTTVATQAAPVALESVLCTDELNRRLSRPPDYESENRALVALAKALADSPRTVLQTLADTILEALDSDSAGISLMSEDGERFYWPAIAGAWKAHIGGGTPRNFGPCGDVLDRDAPLMFSRFQRRYTYFEPVAPQMEEAILIPFHVAGKAVGTIWAVAHNDQRKFDAEDLRKLKSLGRFASAAYQVVQSLNVLEGEGELLRESERRFREMIDALPTAIYTTDAAGRLTHFNPACVAFSGRIPELGSDHWCVTWKLYYPDGTPMPHDECPMAIALKEGRIIRGSEAIAERPDGSRVWFEPYPTPLRDGTGKIVGGINMLLDITERKRAEKTSRASEDRFRALFELGPVAVYSCDQAGVIQEFNRRAAELWGRDPAPGDTEERFCGSFKLFRPDGSFMPHEKCPMAEVVAGKVTAVHDGEVVIERPDGSRVTVVVNIRPLKNEHGAVIGAINCFYDITERKQAEQRLREAKQEAEAANSAKDRFLAVLSHELRTPLTPVVMAVAAMEMNAELPTAVRDDVRMIRRNVELEVKLIDDLLDISRITSGKLRLVFDRLDINELVRQVCTTCRSNIREKGIQLHCDLDEAASEVVGDPARLQQVFWNLLNNAAKFTPEGGHIYIATGNTDGGGAVSVTVRDTGKGIPPEILPRIFDAFEQGEERITRQFGGMGLGLAICKLLLEHHRGTIRAHSQGENKGATFVVELPALSPEQAQRIPPKSPVAGNASAGALRVMVVDDHADTARVLGNLLTASGYVVETATTAAAALSLAAQHRFDLIISDLGLPDMTGYELMKQIKDRYRTKGIALSGYGMEEDIRRSSQAGFNDHLVKPLSFSQLEQSIRRVAANGE